MVQGNTLSGSGSFSGLGSFSAQSLLIFIGLENSQGSGAAVYSSDLVNWTDTSISSNNWKSVVYDGSKFIAFGEYGTIGYYNLATSLDGITWEYARKDFSGDGNYYNIQKVIYGGGKFIGFIGNNQIAYSSDLITWSQQYLYANANNIAYGDGKFVTVQSGYGQYSNVSTDGVNWTYGSMTPDSYVGIAFGNGVFVAAKSGGGVAYSSDGTSWSYASGPSSAMRISFGNGVFIVNAFDQSWYSSDGINWSSTVTLPFALTSLTFQNNIFVGIQIGNTNNICTSSDGINWSTFTMPYTKYWILAAS